MVTLAPGVAASQGGEQNIALTLNTASDVNILTEATSAGWDNTKGGTITATVPSGQTLTASSTSNYALRTGALHADTVLSIIVEGTVQGDDGATGAAGASAGANGSPGGDGGDAIYLEHLTGGSGSVSVNVETGGVLGGGSGGGGGGGGYGVSATAYLDKSGTTCGAPNMNGTTGANGADGTSGQAQAGAAGSAGTNGVDYGLCPVTNRGTGGAGGAAGKAVEDNAKTYSLTANGTIYGATT